MNDRNYVESLNLFLENSHEDWSDVLAVNQGLPERAPRTLEAIARKGNLRILDIGAGNGLKAKNLVQLLGERMRFEAIVDSIEPTPEQREFLKRTYQETGQDGRIYPTTFQEAKLDGKYDLALTFHCLYQFPRDTDGTLLGLERILQLLSESGAWVILHEDKEGGLQMMKDELRQRLGMQRSTTTEYIRKTLEKERIPYEFGGLAENDIDVSELIRQPVESIGKAFSFLFSDHLGDNPLTSEHHREIGQYVRERHGSQGYIRTQNRLIWVVPNK